MVSQSDHKRVTANLGDVVQEFPANPEESGKAKLVAWFLILHGIAGLGFTIKWIVSRGEIAWIQDVALFVVALALLFGGRRIFQFARAQESVRVVLSTDGFIVLAGDREYPFSWDAIESVEEQRMRDHGKVFLIRRRDGESYGLHRLVSSHEELAGAIKKQTDSRGVPWEVVERDR
jgi:hypothetical protein